MIRASSLPARIKRLANLALGLASEALFFRRGGQDPLLYVDHHARSPSAHGSNVEVDIPTRLANGLSNTPSALISRWTRSQSS